MVIIGGKGRRGEHREGEGGINGDGRRQPGVVNTQYNTQMMCYTTVHLTPI